MSSTYTNEEGKQDQALDDLIDCLTPVEKLVFAEYYHSYSIDSQPVSFNQWNEFIELVKSANDDAFDTNIGNEIDYNFDALLASISKGINLGVLRDLEIRQHELAKDYFTEITGDIDHKISERWEG